jgi:hypothetical protein
LENNGEKKVGCRKKNGLENNGEKNRGCERKNVLEKNGENRNGRGEKKRLDRNGENDREERIIFGLGATNCGMLPKLLFPPTAADRKDGRVRRGLILRDPKVGRGTIEVVPAIREGGGRGTNRSVRCVVDRIARAEAIGGDDTMARSSANGDGSLKTELNCRATFDSENRCGPLVNELPGASLSTRELNSDRPWKLRMGRRIGWKARNPYGG